MLPSDCWTGRVRISVPWRLSIIVKPFYCLYFTQNRRHSPLIQISSKSSPPLILRPRSLYCSPPQWLVLANSAALSTAQRFLDQLGSYQLLFVIATRNDILTSLTWLASRLGYYAVALWQYSKSCSRWCHLFTVGNNLDSYTCFLMPVDWARSISERWLWSIWVFESCKLWCVPRRAA